MTTTAGLHASLQADFTLKFTRESVSGTINSAMVASGFLDIMAETGQTFLDKHCIQKVRFLDQNFLSDFHNLPVSIVKPWLSSSWKDYDIFLKKHGSHMLTSITNGSRINQMSFATVSDSYSQRDFNIKCCIALAGTTDIGKLNISNCAGFDDSDIKRVSSLTMSETLTVRGGRPDTRAQLINHRTTELIQKFIDEANTTQTPVRYRFTPIWDILQWAFAGVRGDDLIKAVNLEYYYLGYLNYGCDYRESGSLPLQMFNLANNDARMPEYNCSLAPRGCHSDDDCHFKLGRCFCRGKTCVFHQQVTLDTGGEKLEAKANTDSDLRGYGCFFNFQKLQCSCKYPPTQRHAVPSAAKFDPIVQIIDVVGELFDKMMNNDDIPAKETKRHVVWNGAPKTALFQAHYRMMAAKKNKGKEEL